MTGIPQGTVLQQSCVNNFRGAFSEILAQILIDEDIIGAPLIQSGKTIGLLDPNCMYYLTLQSPVSNANVLWTPMFIQTSLWMDAVRRFRPRLSLSDNINEYLLPRLPDPESLFRLTETIRPLEALLIDRGILETPITVRSKYLYYFDDRCIYQRKRLSPSQKEIRLWHQHSGCLVNRFTWTKAITHFEPGMTLSECLEIFKKIKREKSEAHYTEFERLVQKIERPRIERMANNEATNTADWIRVSVCLARYLYPQHQELLNALRKYKRMIDTMVIEKIESSKQFQRLGIPIGFFTLTECTLCKDNMLVYLFELKSF